MNPNFPTLEHGWGAMWDSNGGGIPSEGYVDVTPRTNGALGTTAGRQYELDQVQSATLTTALLNTDGLMDPTNTAGPWYGHIRPYQPYRVRAQWPPTANLLTPALAACKGLALGAEDASVGLHGQSPVAAAAVDAIGGTGIAHQVTVPVSTSTTTYRAYASQPAISPGVTYSFTIYARCTTAAVSLPVKAEITWRDATNTTISSHIGTTATLVGNATPSGWTVLTVSFTAPAGVAGVLMGIIPSAAVTTACTLQVSGLQWEEAPTATTWGMPGDWYPMYGGFAERWAQSWTMSGTLGTVQPTGVDAFALLSQRLLDDPLTHEISSHAPRFLYRLDDPQGSDSAADATGSFGPAPLAHSKLGGGNLVFGTDVTSVDAGGAFPATGTVMTLNNPHPGEANYFGASYLSLKAAGVTPPDFTASFTRLIMFRYTGPIPGASGAAAFWSATSSSLSNPSSLGFGIQADQHAYVILGGPTTTGLSLQCPGGTVVDGDWHMVYMAYDAPTNTMAVGMDDSHGGAAVLGANTPKGLTFDNLGVWADATSGAQWNFKGDLAYAAEFPSRIANADLDKLYLAWKTQFAGDSTGQRYSRILAYAGYSGASSVATGDTAAMGTADFGDQDALSALQAVVDTEGGEHFVDASGKIVFRARSARYNVANPVYTFGESVADGEWPYEDCQLDHDPTHLGNIAQVTQSSTGAVFTAQDLASQKMYFPRTLQRDVNVVDSFEAQDAAGYLVSRYAQPQTRVASLTLHPAAFPALWPVALSIEMGMRVRVNRRPPGRAPISIECFVVSRAWNVTDKGDAVLTLQCSPADTTPYGVISAWHTNLAIAPATGATTLTITPRNSCASLLPSGTVLWLAPELGVSGREVVTVQSQAGSVLTLTHAISGHYLLGEALTEPVAAGATPDQWDGAGVFDATAFTY